MAATDKVIFHHEVRIYMGRELEADYKATSENIARWIASLMPRGREIRIVPIESERRVSTLTFMWFKDGARTMMQFWTENAQRARELGELWKRKSAGHDYRIEDQHKKWIAAHPQSYKRRQS